MVVNGTAAEDGKSVPKLLGNAFNKAMLGLGASWSGRGGSGRNFLINLVGACGFEPQTPTVSR